MVTPTFDRVKIRTPSRGEVCSYGVEFACHRNYHPCIDGNNHIETNHLYYLLEMKAFHSLVIHVPVSCKEAFIQDLDGLSLVENEAMIRLGLMGVRMFRQKQYHTDDSSLQEALAQKDQERQIFERILLGNQQVLVDTQVNQRVQMLNEQIKKQKEELDNYQLKLVVFECR